MESRDGNVVRAHLVSKSVQAWGSGDSVDRPPHLAVWLEAGHLLFLGLDFPIYNITILDKVLAKGYLHLQLLGIIFP